MVVLKVGSQGATCVNGENPSDINFGGRLAEEGARKIKDLPPATAVAVYGGLLKSQSTSRKKRGGKKRGGHKTKDSRGQSISNKNTHDHVCFGPVDNCHTMALATGDK